MIYIVIALMLLTLGALIGGLFVMVRGGEAGGGMQSNRFMVARVGLQAAALVAVALLFLIGK